MSMDVLNSPNFTNGGVNVYMIFPVPKFYREEMLVSVGKTGIFVGNMGNKKPTSGLSVAAKIMVPEDMALYGRSVVNDFSPDCEVSSDDNGYDEMKIEDEMGYRRFYIYIKFPLMARACTDCPYANNGSKFNTIDITNNKDTFSRNRYSLQYL